MKFSLIDRVIILESILPLTGTIEQIKIVSSIKTKIKLSEEEDTSLHIIKPYSNIVQIDNITSNMLERNTDYLLSEDELNLLKMFTKSVDENGWVTESSLSTVEYILNYNIEEYDKK